MLNTDGLILNHPLPSSTKYLVHLISKKHTLIFCKQRTKLLSIYTYIHKHIYTNIKTKKKEELQSIPNSHSQEAMKEVREEASSPQPRKHEVQVESQAEVALSRAQSPPQESRERWGPMTTADAATIILPGPQFLLSLWIMHGPPSECTVKDHSQSFKAKGCLKETRGCYSSRNASARVPVALRTAFPCAPDSLWLIRACSHEPHVPQ